MAISSADPVPPGTPLDPPQAGHHFVASPPSIKGWLRCGARLLGPPALDKSLNTADLPMMLRIDDRALR